ncbi:hypothetical protein LEP1GSC005_4082 [Leptospira santarosai str. ST188]|nr:hypothetical protein LEP1GSC005_4082 [Leptospira santarosai str. ST188]
MGQILRHFLKFRQNAAFVGVPTNYVSLRKNGWMYEKISYSY